MEFLNSLNPIVKVFYIIAVPSTLFLVIQTILSIIGLGDSDLDADMDVEDPGDLDALDDQTGFRFFSVRGILAFLSVFGWVGIVLMETGMPKVVVILIALIAGFTAMFLIGYLFHSIMRLQSNGNINYHNAVGKTAEVYLTIPPKGEGQGKIAVLVQERYVHVNAITMYEEKLVTGSNVEVVDVLNESTLVVAPLT